MGDEDLEFYDNCISLGCFCGTAAAMERHGLRNHSGPFDWYFSEFDSVLKVIETNFSDFMIKENLFVNGSNPKEFCDMKYGFRCGHDIRHNFEEEYPFIYEKYKRRAEQFMQDVKSPTCFIRAVKSNSEIKFIEENKYNMFDILREGNEKNDIVFLLHKNLNVMSDDFLWFRLNIDKYVGKTYEMRYMFDTSSKFSEYCQGILSPEAISRNIQFDKNHLGVGKRVSIFIGKGKEYFGGKYKK